MSAISLTLPGRGWALPVPRLTRDSATPRLTTLAFTLLVGGILVAGLALVLFINVLTTQGAFEEATLTRDVKGIEAAQQRAQQQLAMLASPGALEARARAMGMVPAAAPVFLRLSDAKVIGTPEPATSQPSPDAVQALMPTQQVLAPDLQMAPAARKARLIAPTSDAAVELVPGSTP